MPDLNNYKGREQTYVKHHFLDTYLDGLLYKIGRLYRTITYVDGYAGPWLSADEAFLDTSFGIALSKLRAVKARLASEGIAISIQAVLVEKNQDAFAKLQEFSLKFPDIEVTPLFGDFHGHLPTIDKISKGSFLFAFIDPKGWSVDLQKLAPLFADRECEVVFNLMFDFVNRFKFLESVEPSLQRLFFGVPDWRVRIENSANKQQEILNCFRDALAATGEFSHCLYTTVLKTDQDRLLYALYYATRHQRGLEVFRDAQVKSLTTQSSMRSELKQRRKEEQTGQRGLFPGAELGASESQYMLNAERERAKKRILTSVPFKPASMRFEDLVALILSEFIVRKINVGQIVGELHKENLVEITPFGPKEKVAKDGKRIGRIKVD